MLRATGSFARSQSGSRSSLAYLQKFPIDTLEIDQSFIAGMKSSSEAKALVRSLVQIAKNLHLDTVAGGIETESQLHVLQLESCERGQGFLLAEPLDPEAATRFLTASGCGRPVVGQGERRRVEPGA